MQFETSEKYAVELEEYQGKWSLSDCYKGNDGVIRKSWAVKQLGKDKMADKATPVKVFLGSPDQAAAVCLAVLKAITGKVYVVEGTAPAQSDDGTQDIPF